MISSFQVLIMRLVAFKIAASALSPSNFYASEILRPNGCTKIRSIKVYRNLTHGIYVHRKNHYKAELRCWSCSRDNMDRTITRHNLMKLSRSSPKTLRTLPDLRLQKPSVTVSFHLRCIGTLYLEQP